MAEITASMVKELRERTDAPMMECKKALAEAGGDMGKAEEILRVKLGNKADRQITNAATPQEARKMSVHYFVLVPKDVRSRYGRIQPELASWILANGERLFAVNGYSYGDIYLYRVDYPDQATKVKQNTTSNPPPNTSHWRSFQPAKGGTIVLFVSGLVLWILLCLIIPVGLAVVKFDYPNLRKLNRLSRYPSQPTARWDMQTEQEVFHERR